MDTLLQNKAQTLKQEWNKWILQDFTFPTEDFINAIDDLLDHILGVK